MGALIELGVWQWHIWHRHYSGANGSPSLTIIVSPSGSNSLVKNVTNQNGFQQSSVSFGGDDVLLTCVCGWAIATPIELICHSHRNPFKVTSASIDRIHPHPPFPELQGETVKRMECVVLRTRYLSRVLCFSFSCCGEGESDTEHHCWEGRISVDVEPWWPQSLFFCM